MDYKCMNNSVQKDKQVPSMAYVPWQHWESLYEPDKALVRGTLFAILDKPFKGGCR
ncbi:MAG: spore coat associated protein CotJA [Lachnospira sp.]|nr:spore coat associated protein CotJA [Lachnospira sp.]